MNLDIWLTVPACDACGRRAEPVYDASITGVPESVWRLAGVHVALVDAGGRRAREIVETFEKGAAFMRANPDAFRELHGEAYAEALRGLEGLAAACRRHPAAVVRSSSEPDDDLAIER